MNQLLEIVTVSKLQKKTAFKYGAHTWTLTKHTIRKLKTIQTDIERTMEDGTTSDMKSEEITRDGTLEEVQSHQANCRTKMDRNSKNCENGSRSFIS